jgi:transcriptional regulator with XRE-family HTH domain
VALQADQVRQLRHLGAAVKRLRKKRGLTQEKLAELVDVAPRTVQKVEAGELNVLFSTVMRFKKALDCSWRSLTGD